MSLKGFHIFFITISSLFAFGFGLWCFLAENAPNSPVYTWLGAVSVLSGIAMVIYGKYFLHKMKKEGI